MRGYDFKSRPVGCAMIDDYIKTPEQVVDYSTRYSGLVSGDLDPAVSKHHLIPLKRAYLKIRYMVDNGWTFVGHHLQKDFRILNIYVPPERIIDTVQASGRRSLSLVNCAPHALSQLYRLPKYRRMLSLRFLAYHVLGHLMQVDTHDSNEDARTALYLYKRCSREQCCATHALVIHVSKRSRPQPTRDLSGIKNSRQLGRTL